MPFDRPTLEEIYQRMVADTETRVTGGIPFPRFSLLGVLNGTFAGAIHLAYGFLVWLSKQFLASTAETIGLDRVALEYGVPRKAATFTTGNVTITGTPAHVIAAGTSAFNSEGLAYLTDTELTIDGFGSIAGTVTAEEEGEDYNTEDSTLTLTNPDADVIAVNITSGFDDGQDEETDTELQARVLQRIQNPPSSGTTSDYEREALKVDGVSKAWCFGAEDWVGAGTVGLIVADEDLQPVSAGVLTDTETAIEAWKPEPAAVDYDTTVPKDIDLFVSITPNTSDIRAAITSNLGDVFLADSSPGGTVLLTALNSAIAAGLVTDYAITAIEEDGSPIAVANIVQTGLDTSVLNNVAYATLV